MLRKSGGYEVLTAKRRVPPDWDNTLPSDITLKLPGDDEPRILLTNRSEFQEAGLSLPEHPIIFMDKLKKAPPTSL